MAFDFHKSLIKVQGRTYLPVSARIVWFREEHPDWGIETEMVALDVTSKYAVFKATIRTDEGRVMAQATKMEDVKGFGDFAEKAETGAIGRALALCGYGTQFEPDMDTQRAHDAPPQAERPAMQEARGPVGRDGTPRDERTPPQERREPGQFKGEHGHRPAPKPEQGDKGGPDLPPMTEAEAGVWADIKAMLEGADLSRRMEWAAYVKAVWGARTPRDLRGPALHSLRKALSDSLDDADVLGKPPVPQEAPAPQDPQ